jgi:hypothetical protein
MTIKCEGQVIRLEGACPVEDAEILLGFFQQTPNLPVDLEGCGAIHTAVLQVLLAARPPVTGVPVDSFAREWISPILKGVNKQ